MKVGFIASPIVSQGNPDLKGDVEKALIKSGFDITTLFPIGTGDANTYAKEWASNNSVNINSLLEQDDLDFFGRIPDKRRKQIIANKDDLALIAMWDGSSLKIANFIKMFKKYNIPVYVTNGKYRIGV